MLEVSFDPESLRNLHLNFLDFFVLIIHKMLLPVHHKLGVAVLTLLFFNFLFKFSVELLQSGKLVLAFFFLLNFLLLKLQHLFFGCNLVFESDCVFLLFDNAPLDLLLLTQEGLFLSV